MREGTQSLVIALTLARHTGFYGCWEMLEGFLERPLLHEPTGDHMKLTPGGVVGIRVSGCDLGNLLDDGPILGELLLPEPPRGNVEFHPLWAGQRRWLAPGSAIEEDALKEQ